MDLVLQHADEDPIDGIQHFDTLVAQRDEHLLPDRRRPAYSRRCPSPGDLGIPYLRPDPSLDEVGMPVELGDEPPQGFLILFARRPEAVIRICVVSCFMLTPSASRVRRRAIVQNLDIRCGDLVVEDLTFDAARVAHGRRRTEDAAHLGTGRGREMACLTVLRTGSIFLVDRR
jgi:hypothetical protein